MRRRRKRRRRAHCPVCQKGVLRGKDCVGSALCCTATCSKVYDAIRMLRDQARPLKPDDAWFILKTPVEFEVVRGPLVMGTDATVTGAHAIRIDEVTAAIVDLKAQGDQGGGTNETG